MKSEWFDRHLLANVAVFDTDYTGVQLNIQVGPSPVLRNAGDAKLRGAELELTAIAGNGFSFNFTGGYIDAKYERIDPRATQADPNVNLNTKLPKTPEWKFTVGPQYELNLANSAALRFNVDYTRTAEIWNDAPNTLLLFRPDSENLKRLGALHLAQLQVRSGAGWHQPHRRPLPGGGIGERWPGRNGGYVQPPA